MANICLFQALKCEDLLLLCVFPQAAETQRGLVVKGVPIGWMQDTRSTRFLRPRRMQFQKRSAKQPAKWAKKPSKKGRSY